MSGIVRNTSGSIQSIDTQVGGEVRRVKVEGEGEVLQDLF